MPPSFEREDFKKYENIFEAILNSKVRPLIIAYIAPYTFFTLEALYDIGIRSGDI